MKEKLKQNWKVIVIIVLALFSLSKCTQSCTRGGKVKAKTAVIDSLTTVIDSQALVINDLQKDTANYINQIKLYKDFDLRRAKNDSIHNVNMAAQQAQTDKLIQQQKKQNDRLLNTIKDKN